MSQRYFLSVTAHRENGCHAVQDVTNKTMWMHARSFLAFSLLHFQRHRVIYT